MFKIKIGKNKPVGEKKLGKKKTKTISNSHTQKQLVFFFSCFCNTNIVTVEIIL